MGYDYFEKKIKLEELATIEGKTSYDDMIKCVIDIDKKIIAVNAGMHCDLEQFLLDNGSKQQSLYRINIRFDNGEIEFDSMINPPRNRDAGYPRVGTYVADPKARKKIVKVVEKWIKK